jgi:3-methyladenine DNA glycosylase AlkD
MPAEIRPQSSVQEIIGYLKSIGAESHKKSLGRMGVPTDTVIGIPTTKIRKLGQQIGRNQKLALDLWKSGFHEARLLAVLVAEPAKMSETAIEDWLEDIVSWDLCDHLCNNLVLHMPSCAQKISVWAKDDREFFRRAAFSSIVYIVIHQPDIADDQLDQYLALIRDYASDPRNYVKKAISWALREIGKKDFSAQEKAILLATELCEATGSAERWVGKDVLKELKTLVAVPGRRRLLSSQTKMGNQVR